MHDQFFLEMLQMFYLWNVTVHLALLETLLHRKNLISLNSGLPVFTTSPPHVRACTQPWHVQLIRIILLF